MIVSEAHVKSLMGGTSSRDFKTRKL